MGKEAPLVGGAKSVARGRIQLNCWLISSLASARVDGVTDALLHGIEDEVFRDHQLIAGLEGRGLGIQNDGPSVGPVAPLGGFDRVERIQLDFVHLGEPI